MVGFGPTIWSRHRGETEYGVKAVPLGGYIRMIGMYPPAPGADPTMLRASTTGRFQTLINDARQQSMEEVTPDAVDRVFYKLPVRKRIVVMLGGPTMNLILAFVLFTIVLCGIGIQTATNTVGAVVPCTPDRHQRRRRAQRQRHLRTLDRVARHGRRAPGRRHRSCRWPAPR